MCKITIKITTKIEELGKNKPVVEDMQIKEMEKTYQPGSSSINVGRGLPVGLATPTGHINPAQTASPEEVPDPLTGREDHRTEEKQSDKGLTLLAKQQPDLGVNRGRKQEGKKAATTRSGS